VDFGSVEASLILPTAWHLVCILSRTACMGVWNAELHGDWRQQRIEENLGSHMCCSHLPSTGLPRSTLQRRQGGERSRGRGGWGGLCGLATQHDPRGRGRRTCRFQCLLGTRRSYCCRPPHSAEQNRQRHQRRVTSIFLFPVPSTSYPNSIFLLLSVSRAWMSEDGVGGRAVLITGTLARFLEGAATEAIARQRGRRLLTWEPLAWNPLL